MAVVAVAYFVAARLSLRLALINSSATAVWPPTGIALAALMLGGQRLWPAIFAGAFAANLAVNSDVVSSLAIASGNTLESVLGAWLVSRFAGGLQVFDEPLGVLKFVAFAAVPSTCVSATAGLGSLLWIGSANAENAGAVWLTWWLGDLGGDLIVAPLLLLWARRESGPRQSGRSSEFLLAMACLLFTALVAFHEGPFGLGRRYPLIFLCFPPLLWLGLRFSQRVSVTAVFILAAIAVRSTLAGQGPFSEWSTNESLALLQAYLGISCVMTLTLGAAILQHRRAEASLQEMRGVLQQQRDDLARSNTDLEQFAYIASHDLKAPLRAVGNLARWLAEDLGASLAAKDKEYLDLMLRRVARMEKMLEDLLAYARAGTQKGPLELAGLEGILREAWDSLGPPAEFRLDAPTLPTVQVPATLFRRLLLNLLNNAVKHHDKGRGVITVTATMGNGRLKLTMRDDGPGIPKADRERAFQMFQTLRPRDETEGTGIGLALVKKIVDEQGGRVWIEDKAGRGCEICVLWPLRGEEAA